MEKSLVFGVHFEDFESSFEAFCTFEDILRLVVEGQTVGEPPSAYTSVVRGSPSECA